MISGHCNCGAVRFDIKCEPAGVYVCHCSICRRSTGSSGIAVVVVKNEDFEWTGGVDQIVQWSLPGASWDTWFCKTCGAKVPGHNDPKRMFIPAGLLPGDLPGLKVIHHLFVGSRAAWDVIGDDGQQHATRIGA